MKTTLFLCIVACAVAGGAVGQTSRVGGQIINLTLGPAFPVGSYASKSDNSTSGLANIGPMANLSYQHPFHDSRFGWMVSLKGRFNGENKSASLKPVQEQYPAYQQWSINHNRWTTASALGGGYFERPLTTKLSFTVHVEIGVAEVWSPNQSITGLRDSVGYGYIDMVQAHLQPKTATTFTVEAGLGVRYQWHGRWSLLAQVDYSYLKPTFKNLTATEVVAEKLVVPANLSIANASEVFYYSGSRNYAQAMNSLDVRVGVGWTLR